MQADNLYFVIPTYRLRDVGETVESYDEHFWRNGHAPTIIVCDDSSPSAQEKYFAALEQTSTHCELYYVGPKRERTIHQLSAAGCATSGSTDWSRICSAQLRRQSQFHADAHAGGLMISSDDDMRPYA